MHEQPKNPRSLSDISHLFLSSVRDRQTGGSPRPQRTPPPKVDARDADLTPEEFQHVLNDAPAPSAEGAIVPPVRAIIASHLGARQFDAVRGYARSLAASGRRVGLIWIDVSEFALMTYEPDESAPERHEESAGECFDARVMREAIAELNCDVECWVLAVANPRVAEGRALLKNVSRWVLLSAKDHDAVVACYRTLKGLADLHRPRLSIAALDVSDPAESEQVFSKMASTCMQFLNWPLEAEPPVGEAPHVAECMVMQCSAQGDKAQLATAGHWQVVADLLEQAQQSTGENSEPLTPEAVINPSEMFNSESSAKSKNPNADELSAAQARLRRLTPTPQVEVAPVTDSKSTIASEVIALPEEGGSLLDAVMRHSMTEIIECPIRPPMCPDARLAVSRDRRLMLIAAAGHGLRELRDIGLAYRWLVENRALLAMALPQLAVDARQLPHLRLLVDQADLNAEVLQPIFQVNTVTICSYRKLRWGERNGVLLDAA
ncbi:MAG TPA: hypothetical protein VGQ99_03020 [Tepidisphaeraceae bacterium]|jgi:hypothetical protein|nr:hypothetical protein [Tepidisphaeraceae bacterium]